MCYRITGLNCNRTVSDALCVCVPPVFKVHSCGMRAVHYPASAQHPHQRKHFTHFVWRRLSHMWLHTHIHTHTRPACISPYKWLYNGWAIADARQNGGVSVHEVMQAHTCPIMCAKWWFKWRIGWESTKQHIRTNLRAPITGWRRICAGSRGGGVVRLKTRMSLHRMHRLKKGNALAHISRKFACRHTQIGCFPLWVHRWHFGDEHLQYSTRT